MLEVTKKPEPSIFDVDEKDARKRIVDKVNELIKTVRELKATVKGLQQAIDDLTIGKYQ